MMLLPELTLTMHLGNSPSVQRYVFEPLFPSLVTRLTDPTPNGTASGVYNFCQFVGHFAGAAIAGIFYSTNLVFLLGLLLMINLGFLFMLYKNFSNPIPREKPDTEKIKSKPEINERAHRESKFRI